MKERPILFSGPMVRALLAGIKTQTRRVVKPQPTGFVDVPCASMEIGSPARRVPVDDSADPAGQVIACPYGMPGDRLRVRETFFAYGRWEARPNEGKGRDEWRFVDMTIGSGRAYLYAEGGNGLPLSTRQDASPGWHKRPAIFMPRAASRILLEIIDIRIERLNDCSEQDAVAEGIGLGAEAIGPGAKAIGPGAKAIRPGAQAIRICAASHAGESPAVLAYRTVWESINGAGSWSANPWVWVVEFRPCAP